MNDHRCGIYQIRNKINNDIYIGSTNDFHIRKRSHFNLLSKNKHFNPILQAAYDKYGRKKFIFEPLITCDQSLLFWYEQQFLDEWSPRYNVSKYAEIPTMRGDHLSKEHKEKIRIANTGYKHSEETKKKIGLAGKGRKYSKKTREIWSKQRKGHENDAEYHVGLVSPDGTIHKNIFNMAKFCRKYNLNAGAIGKMEKGKQPYHKGWVLWRGIDPSKCEHEFIQKSKKGRFYCKFCHIPEKIVIRRWRRKPEECE